MIDLGRALVVGILLATSAGCARRSPSPPLITPTTVRIEIAARTDTLLIAADAALTIETAAGELFRSAPSTRLELSPSAERGLLILNATTFAAAPASRWWAELASPIRIGSSAKEGIRVAGRSYWGGFQVVRDSSTVRAINEVDLETYLQGVVPHEIGLLGDDEIEAIKAQAVASRTYAFAKLMAATDPLQATVMDQVYRGLEGRSAVVNRAISATRGLILTHSGSPALSLFHSTCAGETARIEAVWDGADPVPYLISIDDRDGSGTPLCAGSKYYSWTESWSRDELLETLRRRLPEEFPDSTFDLAADPDPISIEVLEWTDTGHIRSALIEAWGTDFELPGERLRWVLRRPGTDSLMRSARITEIAWNERALSIQGEGWGHGLGMCQVGAIERARRGEEWQEILEHYYPGTAIALVSTALQ